MNFQKWYFFSICKLKDYIFLKYKRAVHELIIHKIMTVLWNKNLVFLVIIFIQTSQLFFHFYLYDFLKLEFKKSFYSKVYLFKKCA